MACKKAKKNRLRGVIMVDTETLSEISEVVLTYRNKVDPKDRVTIANSESAHRVLKNSWDENRIELIEQFKILLLDYRNSCLGISEISTGGINQCPVDLKIVFATALKAKASKIIAAHNHPSGNCIPSGHDIALTKQLVAAGELLGIELVEHIIITAQGYYSFADNGLIP